LVIGVGNPEAGAGHWALGTGHWVLGWFLVLVTAVAGGEVFGRAGESFGWLPFRVGRVFGPGEVLGEEFVQGGKDAFAALFGHDEHGTLFEFAPNLGEGETKHVR
jgi:hypothetical protein